VIAENLRLIRTLIDTIPNPVFFKDARGRYQECNETFARQILGLPRERIIGATVFDLAQAIPRELADQYHAEDTQLLREKKVQVYQSEVQCADAKRRMFQCSKAVVGEGEGVVGIMLDITSILEYQEQLHAKSREIKSFTDTVTHDLRKPLAALKSIFHLLATQSVCTLTEDGDKAVKIGHDAIGYMHDMLDDLLECSRLESGGHKFNPETLDAGAILSLVLECLKYQIEEKKITIHTNCPAHPVVADPKLLTKIFMNLIGNAVSYIGDGPDRRIDISCVSEQGATRFEVRDNGIGIPDDSKPGIFDKFKRGANTSGIPGTGLGLAIVKAAVEMHGGAVRFDSTLGKGAQFCFTIPVGKAHSTA
jgi:PAS domain S-box-containing protein